MSAGSPKRPQAEAAELDMRMRGAVARRYPTISGYDMALVIGARADIGPGLFDSVAKLIDALNTGTAVRLERLVEELSSGPEHERSLLDSASKEADVRERILRDFSRPGIVPQDDADRWAAEGRVFAVPSGGDVHYLSFQFDGEGQARPVIAGVLEALHEWLAWDIAKWFVTANGLLRRVRPLDVLDKRPAAVISAAQRDAAGASRARTRQRET